MATIKENTSLPLPKKIGAPRKIETPTIFWDIAADYFKEIDANPWYKQELIKSGDLAGCIIPVATQRPYTWTGLGVYFLKRGYNTRLDEYKSNRKGGYEEFSEVIKQIDQIMYEQKFEGATLGAFNANIISADLGLAQKTIIETRDKTDDFDYSELSEAALEEIAAAKLKAKDND